MLLSRETLFQVYLSKYNKTIMILLFTHTLEENIRENSILNTTEITNTTAQNASFCVKACTLADGCFSINAGKETG